ncbi:hypothetical protein GAH_00320 [Geoglobus ahangari]|uniref:Uncharacterized protein n=1 Tax=Geoglobus ahangari TaxID=113653 RepID=A0A0F7IF98_9EURY|nr:hypothetical protein [Geoglobus ahangari]AKG92327.1 hypothetical protein GAH_00320 [Geoglobus ahangari]
MRADIKDGVIRRVVVGAYEFVATVPADKAGEVEKHFTALAELGVRFDIKRIDDAKIEKFIRELTDKQRRILEHFRDSDEVSMDDLRGDVGDLRGPIAGLNTKARREGLVGENEQALEPDVEKGVYRLNPKMRVVVERLVRGK